jgi:hypothetical protein
MIESMNVGSRMAVSIGLVALVLVGCATLPAAKPVTELSQVAGTWEGTAHISGGSTLAIRNMVVRPDGTWELEIPGGNPVKNTGTVQLVDGRLRGHSATSGNRSTWTLHEGDGKRVLKIVNDDGRISSELMPVKR